MAAISSLLTEGLLESLVNQDIADFRREGVPYVRQLLAPGSGGLVRADPPMDHPLFPLLAG